MATHYYSKYGLANTGWGASLANFLGVPGFDSQIPKEALNDIRNEVPYLKYATDAEIQAIIENNNLFKPNDSVIKKFLGNSYDEIDIDTLKKYANEIQSNADLFNKYPEKQFSSSSVYADAQAQIEAENQALLDSLNEDLDTIGSTYAQQRDALLNQQYQRNAQTMDTMASDMQRARRNAIEAGASAGIRIAGNVNAVLSAQNKMSQESLNTSNQLAQMLVNQRNAEAGLRDQWRDAQRSTYDRTQARYSAEYGRKQDAYDEALSNWNQQVDSKISTSNPFLEHQKQKSQRLSAPSF